MKTRYWFMAAAMMFASANASAGWHGDETLPGGTADSSGTAGAMPSRWDSWILQPTHKKITKGVFQTLDLGAYPDLSTYRDIIVDESNDESAHAQAKDDGGDPKDLWDGITAHSKGGVIPNYIDFNFTQAYFNVGRIVHLTQDQAVPAHAGNILHGIYGFLKIHQDWVEFCTDFDHHVDFSPLPDRIAYVFYQDVQDDTRSRLPGWINKETGVPFWVASPKAPPIGQDSTMGEHGQYGGGHDSYARYENSSNAGDNNNDQKLVILAPEIGERQLAMAASATGGVLMAASKRLPPLVWGLRVTGTASKDAPAKIGFDLYDNRSASLLYSVRILDAAGKTVIAALPPASTTIIPGDKNHQFQQDRFTVSWDGFVNGAALAPGSYTVEVRAKDGDGNITPDEVNLDSNPNNKTRIQVTVK